MEVFKAECERDLEKKLNEMKERNKHRTEMSASKTELEMRRNYIEIGEHESIVQQELREL